MKISCIIVDDDIVYCKLIASYLAAHPRLSLKGIYTDPEEAKKSLQEEVIQLAFLDMEMPAMSGLDLVRSLDEPPYVIFITSFADYAVEGFELDAVDYILKPVREERFDVAAKRAISRIDLSNHSGEVTDVLRYLKAETDFFIVRVDSQYVTIKYLDVVYIESHVDFVKIFTSNSSYLVLISMKALEEALPTTMFVRTHRSYLAGIFHITSFDTTTIESGKIKIPVSLSYRDSVMERMLNKRLIKK